ncbi:MAG: biopolymer transporter ExbD [Crocinitomicaceae bacterium]|nr:biopolymer transporter ExbD [Crocinitomicaceae bacterium]|tara:strand:+ start:727 stop:1188 length:462 start_codon:yes stop_codon:yes gene_type:complete
MSKFKPDKQKGTPAISTASLPDIVFMLLFFFMVTTVMRETDVLVEVEQPSASEVEKLENKSLVFYIYIGEPMDPSLYGTASRVQLNDAIADINDVRPAVETFRTTKVEAEIPLITTSLKVDKATKMGIVTDVKQELRLAQALKISYAAFEKED